MASEYDTCNAISTSSCFVETHEATCTVPLTHCSASTSIANQPLTATSLISAPEGRHVRCSSDILLYMGHRKPFEAERLTTAVASKNSTCCTVLRFPLLYLLERSDASCDGRGSLRRIQKALVRHLRNTLGG